MEGHQLDWMSAKVIDREKRWRSRKVKEALWIRNTESTLNRDKGWDIDPLWFSLLYGVKEMFLFSFFLLLVFPLIAIVLAHEHVHLPS